VLHSPATTNFLISSRPRKVAVQRKDLAPESVPTRCPAHHDTAWSRATPRHHRFSEPAIFMRIARKTPPLKTGSSNPLAPRHSLGRRQANPDSLRSSRHAPKSSRSPRTKGIGPATHAARANRAADRLSGAGTLDARPGAGQALDAQASGEVAGMHQIVVQSGVHAAVQRSREPASPPGAEAPP